MRRCLASVAASRPPFSLGTNIGARNLFIQTQESPNPNTMIFRPGKEVMGDQGIMEFTSGATSHHSPLARRIFRIDGVVNLLYGPDFVSVTKEQAQPWELLKPEIFGCLTEFYMSGEELITGDTAPEDTAILDDDSEVVRDIKELLDTRIRPMVHLSLIHI